MYQIIYTYDNHMIVVLIDHTQYLTYMIYVYTNSIYIYLYLLNIPQVILRHRCLGDLEFGSAQWVWSRAPKGGVKLDQRVGYRIRTPAATFVLGGNVESFPKESLKIISSVT